MADMTPLVAQLEEILADVETMGDAAGNLSPGERASLRERLDELWAQRDRYPMDAMCVALFEHARRIVDGARDS